MFNFIKQAFRTIYTQFSSKLATILKQKTLNETTIKELEKLLIAADTGISTTRYIINRLKTESSHIPLDKTLQTILLDILQEVPQPARDAHVYLLMGINGSGKTTFAGKLAHYYVTQGKRVLMVAADTFRAAASNQLHVWAQQVGVSIVTGNAHQDPASVIFEGCSQFMKEKFDVLIIDTAGRLQTKTNLMHELAKIKKVITKQLPQATLQTLLTIDAMLGQNSFEQATLFKECTALSGIVLTKMDSTGKGGIVFAIAKELQIPVLYVSYGEKIEQMVLFDASKYVQELMYERI